MYMAISIDMCMHICMNMCSYTLFTRFHRLGQISLGISLHKKIGILSIWKMCGPHVGHRATQAGAPHKTSLWLLQLCLAIQTSGCESIPWECSLMVIDIWSSNSGI